MNTENNVFYHKSTYNNLTFNLELSKEIGLHCGTFEQANNRPGNYLYELVVDTSKMCELKDSLDIHWSGLSFLRELQGAGIIDAEQYSNFVKEFRDKLPAGDQEMYKSEFCRKVLRTLGYTGFIYANHVEGEGNSICIIDKDVIKTITPISEALHNWSSEFKLYENLWD